MSIEFTGISEKLLPENIDPQQKIIPIQEIAEMGENGMIPIQPTTDPPPPEIPPKKGENKPKKALSDVNNKTRHTYSVNLPINEGDFVNKIIQARIEAGITDSTAHFFVQCVDFAVNHIHGTNFAVPAFEKVPFKNGFYSRNSVNTIKK